MARRRNRQGSSGDRKGQPAPAPPLTLDDLTNVFGGAERAVKWFTDMCGAEVVLAALVGALAARLRPRRGESDVQRAIRYATLNQRGGPPRRPTGRPKHTRRHDDSAALNYMVDLLFARQARSLHDAAVQAVDANLVTGVNTTRRVKIERLLRRIRKVKPESITDPEFTLKFFATPAGRDYLATPAEDERVVQRVTIRGRRRVPD